MSSSSLIQPSNNPHADLTYQIGHDVIGPVIHRWLLALHQHMAFFDDGQTKFLFCARAGVRIDRLYKLFVRGFASQAEIEHDIFWTSRVAACKGTFASAKERSAALIAKEYAHEPISNLIRGILRNCPDSLASLDMTRDEYKAHGNVFPGWIQGPTPAAALIRDYLLDCSESFDGYLRSLTNDARRVVLVDSGWQGTMQSLLSRARPDIQWRGLYFGRILTDGHDSDITSHVVGLMFESENYKTHYPETAFTRHRHLIETILEPNAPSVEEIPYGKFANIASKFVDANKNEVIDSVNDAIYLAVMDYLSVAGAGASISDIVARHQEAMTHLARILVTPNRREAQALVCKARSADFGRDIKVPVLLGGDVDGRDRRLATALWQEGQIALEHKGDFAKDLQLRASGLRTTGSYFDAISQDDPNKGSGSGKVAIITRTKNRPLLLRRAAESVSQQTYHNYQWVIVNDGGDVDDVYDVIKRCSIDRRKITLISNSTSTGMEAASNIGIGNSLSEFIVIHDDDDSWEPDFLMETVNYLASPAGKRYGGVVTGTTYVSEEIRGDQVIEHGRQPYMDWLRNVQLAEMAAGNLFAPISFIFRRKVWEEVGGFNEALPVLGDWFFNLEFLSKTDIGVLPIPLANYHHRDRGEVSSYANSVVGGISKHEEFSAVVRNEILRKNIESPGTALAILLGYFAPDFRRGPNGSHSAAESIVRLEKSGYSLADKYWAVLNINKNRRYFQPFRNKRDGIDESISWEDLALYIREKRIPIPVPPDFDDHEYLRKNEDVAFVVRAGGLPSGYQHFLMHGYLEGRERPCKDD